MQITAIKRRYTATKHSFIYSGSVIFLVLCFMHHDVAFVNKCKQDLHFSEECKIVKELGGLCLLTYCTVNIDS